MTDFDRAKVEARYQWALGVVGHRNGVLLHPEDAVIVAELMRQDALLAPPPSSAAKRILVCARCGHHEHYYRPDEASEGSEPKLESRADLHLTETQQEKEGLAATVPQPPAAIDAQGREP